MKSVSLGVYYPLKEEGRPISGEPQIRQVAQVAGQGLSNWWLWEVLMRPGRDGGDSLCSEPVGLALLSPSLITQLLV